MLAGFRIHRTEGLNNFMIFQVTLNNCLHILRLKFAIKDTARLDKHHRTDITITHTPGHLDLNLIL